jgi:hypothetical protein
MTAYSIQTFARKMIFMVCVIMPTLQRFMTSRLQWHPLILLLAHALGIAPEFRPFLSCHRGNPNSRLGVPQASVWPTEIYSYLQ